MTPDAIREQMYGRVLPTLETDVWKLEQTKRSEEYKFKPIASLVHPVTPQ